MKTIQPGGKYGKDLVVLLDDEDYERINKHCWYVLLGKSNHKAAVRVAYNAKHREMIYMHREILGLTSRSGWSVDHIERYDTMIDNRRCNLRLVTQTQNNMNARPKRGCASKFKGVSWCNQNEKWHARIYVNRKYKHLGFFVSELDAARAYDNAACTFFGEYALPNFRAQVDHED